MTTPRGGTRRSRTKTRRDPPSVAGARKPQKMDHAEILEILEQEIRNAKGIAKVQAIKLWLEESRRDGNEDVQAPSAIDELAVRRAT